MQIKQDADDGRQSGACGGGQSHGKERFRKVAGGQPGKGNAHAHDRDGVVEKGYGGASVGAEIAAEAKVDSRQGAVPYIAVHVLAAQPDGVGIVGKQSHCRACNKLHGGSYGNAERGAQQNSIAQRRAGAVVFSCADILRAERRHRGEHGGGHEKQDADNFFYDAHGCRVIQAASVGEYCNHDERNLNKTVLKGHGETDL